LPTKSHFVLPYLCHILISYDGLMAEWNKYVCAHLCILIFPTCWFSKLFWHYIWCTM